MGLAGYKDVPCQALSAGQQRRVSLARLPLLGMAAPLWLLDEPFTALDDRGIALVTALLEEHQAAGGGAIFTTHQPLTPRPGLETLWLGSEGRHENSWTLLGPVSPRRSPGPAPARRAGKPLAFFVLVITLFPLGVSPESAVLAPLAAGVLWIAALLATLLGLEGLFAGIGMRVRLNSLYSTATP